MATLKHEQPKRTEDPLYAFASCSTPPHREPMIESVTHESHQD